MNIEASDKNEERNSLFPAYLLILQAIMMQNLVVEPLSGGTLLHDRLEGIAAPGDSGK